MTKPNDDSTAITDDQKIVESSIEHADSDETDALRDDERSWINTVVRSLEGRSQEAKQALVKALLDGQHCGNPAGLTTFSMT